MEKLRHSINSVLIKLNVMEKSKVYIKDKQDKDKQSKEKIIKKHFRHKFIKKQH